MNRRIVVTGAAGQLGRELVRALSVAGDEVLGLARPSFDITTPAHLERLVDWRPEVVINTAAWTDVDGCAGDPIRAMWINGEAAGAVAEAAARAGALGFQISTNEVFDGTLERPYVEHDDTNPINPYGVSKLAGERLAASANPRTVIVRTAWLYSDAHGFPAKIRKAEERSRLTGEPLRVVADEWGNPTPAAWLADALLVLLGAPELDPGIYHLAGIPATNRYEWAQHVLGPGDRGLTPISRSEFTRPSVVPERAVLDVSLAASMGIAPVDWRQP